MTRLSNPDGRIGNGKAQADDQQTGGESLMESPGDTYAGQSVWKSFRAAGSEYRAPLGATIGLFLIFSFTVSGFFSVANLTNTWETDAVLLILAVGLTFTMLGGGLDLSIAGVVPLSGLLFAKLVEHGMPIAAAIAIIVVGSIAFGLGVNGVLVGVFKVNFFIVTLGSLTALQGLALYVTQGQTILMVGHKFLTDIGTGQVGIVPIAGLIAVVVLVLGALVLRYTGLGRAIYAVGGNSEAARLAGVHVALTSCLTYGISAGLASIGGIIEVGRLGSAGPTTDSAIELTAAAAVLIGGVSFGGGKGTALGTLLGVGFLSVLSSGLLISGISSYLTEMITGVVLIASVTADRLRRT
jgi:ribose transport system permease protein